MSCKTQQSSRQKTTVVATDSTAITQVAAQDSASIIARVDSIIIEEYNTDERESITPCVSQSKPGLKCSYQKRNDTSQKQTGSLKKKTKIYGANLSSTWLTKTDSLNKNMVHQEKSNTQIKQKTPTQKRAVGKIGYIIIAIVVIIFVGYLIGKNAVQ
jgi:hypothetical protein